MDRVCHFEVPYSDKQRMEKFYSDVFGWQFMSAPGEMPYTFVITTGGATPGVKAAERVAQ